MKHWLLVIIALGGLTHAGRSTADSTLIPVKLATLLRVGSGPAAKITRAPEGPPKGAAAAALYYVSTMSTDTNGNPLANVIPLVRLAGAGAGDLGFVWSIAGEDSGLVPVPGAVAGTGAVGYAYPRSADRESLVAVSAAGVTVKSNMNAGGAVWEWSAKGKQFIDDYDYGRQLSMAIYTSEGRALQETGDNYGAVSMPLYARHPSPTAYLRNSANRQSSRAIPLDWSPEARSGGKDNPVIYVNARLGKEVTLDWTGPDKVERNWPVALYESVYEGPAFPVAVVEAPTAYLTAEFNHYYRYDPNTDSLIAVPAYHTKINISGGAPSGLIVASGSGPDAIAMGVYVADPNAGIVLYDNSGPDGGQYGSSFSKWSVIYRSTVSSVWRFRTWISTDSVQNVRSQFHQLYQWGVTSRDLNRPPSAGLSPLRASARGGSDQPRHEAQQPQ